MFQIYVRIIELNQMSKYFWKRLISSSLNEFFSEVNSPHEMTFHLTNWANTHCCNDSRVYLFLKHWKVISQIRNKYVQSTHWKSTCRYLYLFPTTILLSPAEFNSADLSVSLATCCGCNVVHPEGGVCSALNHPFGRATKNLNHNKKAVIKVDVYIYRWPQNYSCR